MREQNSVVGLPPTSSLIDEVVAQEVAPRSTVSGLLGQVTVFLAFAGFIGLGLVSSRLGVTWPAMQVTFGMPLDAVGMLLIAQLVGSVAVSANSGQLTARLNIGVLSAWSCGILAVALLGSGITSSWVVLVILSGLTGIGCGLIEAGLNTYAATFFSLRSMNWLHASFGVGATLGLMIMTAVVAGSWGWRSGFVLVGVIELLLAVCFVLTQRHWRSSAQHVTAATDVDGTSERNASVMATLRLPVAWIAIALFVVFTGAQASAGQWLYSLLTEQRGIGAALAGTWVSMLWGSLTVGRIAFGFVVHRFAPTQILRVCMSMVLLSTILLWLNASSWLTFASIALMGLASAPVFPLLTSATPLYFGARHAANGVGLQVAAAGLGGVLMTSLVGMLAQSFGLGVIAPALVVAGVLMVALFELLARRFPTAHHTA